MAEKFKVKMRASEFGVYRNLAESHTFTNKEAAEKFVTKVNKPHNLLSHEERDTLAYVVYAQAPVKL